VEQCYCCYFCCRRRFFCCCCCCRRRHRRRRRRHRHRRLLRRHRGAGNRQVAAVAAAASAASAASAAAVADTDQQRPLQSWAPLPTKPTKPLWNHILVRNNRLLGCCVQQTLPAWSLCSCRRPRAASVDTALASNPLGPSA